MENEKKTSIFTERLSLRMTEENKLYIGEMAWKNSMTVTQYIHNLIEKDKLKNPKWRDTIDILNTGSSS